MAHKRSEYTIQEKKNIVEYIVKNNRYLDIKGKTLWKQMEEIGVCARTWQSMKEHFNKKIAKEPLQRYNLTEDEKRKLLHCINKKGPQFGLKKKVKHVTQQYSPPRHHELSDFSDDDINLVTQNTQKSNEQSQNNARTIIEFSSDDNLDLLTENNNTQQKQTKSSNQFQDDLQTSKSTTLRRRRNFSSDSSDDEDLYNVVSPSYSYKRIRRDSDIEQDNNKRKNASVISIDELDITIDRTTPSPNLLDSELVLSKHTNKQNKRVCNNRSEISDSIPKITTNVEVHSIPKITTNAEVHSVDSVDCNRIIPIRTGNNSTEMTSGKFTVNSNINLLDDEYKYTSARIVLERIKPAEFCQSLNIRPFTQPELSISTKPTTIDLDEIRTCSEAINTQTTDKTSLDVVRPFSQFDHNHKPTITIMKEARLREAVINRVENTSEFGRSEVGRDEVGRGEVGRGEVGCEVRREVGRNEVRRDEVSRDEVDRDCTPLQSKTVVNNEAIREVDRDQLRPKRVVSLRKELQSPILISSDSDSNDMDSEINRRSSQDSENNDQPFSIEEDTIIINFLKQPKHISDIEDNTTFQMMAKKCSLKRSWTALQARFISHIAPNLYKYKCLTLNEMIMMYDGAGLIAPPELLKLPRKRNCDGSENTNLDLITRVNSSLIEIASDEEVELCSTGNNEQKNEPIKSPQSSQNSQNNKEENIQNGEPTRRPEIKEAITQTDTIYSCNDELVAIFRGEEHIFVSNTTDRNSPLNRKECGKRNIHVVDDERLTILSKLMNVKRVVQTYFDNIITECVCDCDSPEFIEHLRKTDHILSELSTLAQYQDNVNKNNEDSHQQNKVSDQKNTVSEQQNKVSEQQNKVSDQQSKVSDQQSKVTEQRNEVSDQQSNVSDQQSKVSDQQSKVTHQRNEVSDQQSNVIDQQSKASDQQNKASDQQNKVSDSEKSPSLSPVIGIVRNKPKSLSTPNHSNVATLKSSKNVIEIPEVLSPVIKLRRTRCQPLPSTSESSSSGVTRLNRQSSENVPENSEVSSPVIIPKTRSQPLPSTSESSSSGGTMLNTQSSKNVPGNSEVSSPVIIVRRTGSQPLPSTSECSSSGVTRLNRQSSKNVPENSEVSNPVIRLTRTRSQPLPITSESSSSGVTILNRQSSKNVPENSEVLSPVIRLPRIRCQPLPSTSESSSSGVTSLNTKSSKNVLENSEVSSPVIILTRTESQPLPSTSESSSSGVTRLNRQSKENVPETPEVLSPVIGLRRTRSQQLSSNSGHPVVIRLNKKRTVQNAKGNTPSVSRLTRNSSEPISISSTSGSSCTPVTRLNRKQSSESDISEESDVFSGETVLLPNSFFGIRKLTKTYSKSTLPNSQRAGCSGVTRLRKTQSSDNIKPISTTTSGVSGVTRLNKKQLSESVKHVSPPRTSEISGVKRLNEKQSSESKHTSPPKIFDTGVSGVRRLNKTLSGQHDFSPGVTKLNKTYSTTEPNTIKEQVIIIEDNPEVDSLNKSQSKSKNESNEIDIVHDDILSGSDFLNKGQNKSSPSSISSTQEFNPIIHSTQNSGGLENNETNMQTEKSHFLSERNDKEINSALKKNNPSEQEMTKDSSVPDQSDAQSVSSSINKSITSIKSQSIVSSIVSPTFTDVSDFSMLKSSQETQQTVELLVQPPLEVKLEDLNIVQDNDQFVDFYIKQEHKSPEFVDNTLVEEASNIQERSRFSNSTSEIVKMVQTDNNTTDVSTSTATNINIITDKTNNVNISSTNQNAQNLKWGTLGLCNNSIFFSKKLKDKMKNQNAAFLSQDGVRSSFSSQTENDSDNIHQNSQETDIKMEIDEIFPLNRHQISNYIKIDPDENSADSDFSCTNEVSQKLPNTNAKSSANLTSTQTDETNEERKRKEAENLNQQENSNDIKKAPEVSSLERPEENVIKINELNETETANSENTENNIHIQDEEFISPKKGIELTRPKIKLKNISEIIEKPSLHDVSFKSLENDMSIELNDELNYNNVNVEPSLPSMDFGNISFLRPNFLEFENNTNSTNSIVPSSMHSEENIIPAQNIFESNADSRESSNSNIQKYRLLKTVRLKKNKPIDVSNKPNNAVSSQSSTTSTNIQEITIKVYQKRKKIEQDQLSKDGEGENPLKKVAANSSSEKNSEEMFQTPRILDSTFPTENNLQDSTDSQLKQNNNQTIQSSAHDQLNKDGVSEKSKEIVENSSQEGSETIFLSLEAISQTSENESRNNKSCDQIKENSAQKREDRGYKTPEANVVANCSSEKKSETISKSLQTHNVSNNRPYKISPISKFFVSPNSSQECESPKLLDDSRRKNCNISLENSFMLPSSCEYYSSVSQEHDYSKQ